MIGGQAPSFTMALAVRSESAFAAQIAPWWIWGPGPNHPFWRMTYWGGWQVGHQYVVRASRPIFFD